MPINQWISAGLYTGISVQTKFNIEDFYNRLEDSGFNAHSFHLMTPWDNPDSFFQWKRVNNVFRLGQKNELFYDHFRKMGEAAAKRNIGFHFGFFDQYHVKKWLQSRWRTCPFHPFRQNDARINWAESEKPLYSNWNHANANDPKNFAWFFFKTDARDNITFWKPTNKLGEAMIQYIRDIIQICREIREDYPKFKLRYKVFNESLLMTENNKWELERGRDVDERTLRLVRMFWREAGFFPNNNFRETVDVVILEDGELNVGRHLQLQRILSGIKEPKPKPMAAASAARDEEGGQPEDELYEKFKRMVGEPEPTGPQALAAATSTNQPLVPARILVEIHGRDSLSDIPKQLNPTFNLFSSDGSKEDPTYYQRMRTMKNLANVDLKFITFPKPWNVRDINVNVRNGFPQMNKIFGGQ